MRRAFVCILAVALAAALPAGAGAEGMPAPVGYTVGPIADLSGACPGGTGDVGEATDPTRGDVYVAFEGCDNDNAIAFARSIDRGNTYSPAVVLPGSQGGWDPQLAVAPDGTLYAVFMNTIHGRSYPILDVSDDGGQTFDVQHSLAPAQDHNWGDAPYIAIGADGSVYVAWDYGPSTAKVREACASNGSCYATSGDLNVVVQRSDDGGHSFGPMADVSTGYPDSGADEGAITVSPDGAVDVLYQGYQVLSPKTLELGPGQEYFSSSTDGGQTWTAPVTVGAAAGPITVDEWWNDGSIASDPSGDLYATWDSQGRAGEARTDTGWLSDSTDGGRDWSAPVQVTPDQSDVPHIVEVTGAGPGQAYIGWLSNSDPRGWALYMRTFSSTGGWLSAPARISNQFGKPNGFPGDTFGIATLSPSEPVLSWGSVLAGAGGDASVFAAPVTVHDSSSASSGQGPARVAPP